eukprot:TRINITY_DN16780_c0_g1_i5.p1 TRINITY_DN16780_c0_g1~~TRINITY_DN16780_c0_g1_i5.p1  ORF type:complete len:420 (+),score=100.99 TRINITY_DN16780_c0_g1_i5:87-1346(+)
MPFNLRDIEKALAQAIPDSSDSESENGPYFDGGIANGLLRPAASAAEAEMRWCRERIGEIYASRKVGPIPPGPFEEIVPAAGVSHERLLYERVCEKYGVFPEETPPFVVTGRGSVARKGAGGRAATVPAFAAPSSTDVSGGGAADVDCGCGAAAAWLASLDGGRGRASRTGVGDGAGTVPAAAFPSAGGSRASVGIPPVFGSGGTASVGGGDVAVGLTRASGNGVGVGGGLFGGASASSGGGGGSPGGLFGSSGGFFASGRPTDGWFFPDVAGAGGHSGANSSGDLLGGSVGAAASGASALAAALPKSGGGIFKSSAPSVVSSGPAGSPSSGGIFSSPRTSSGVGTGIFSSPSTSSGAGTAAASGVGGTITSIGGGAATGSLFGGGNVFQFRGIFGSSGGAASTGSTTGGIFGFGGPSR